MHITIVSHLFPTPKNSVKGIFVLQQAKALSKRGHQVEVISPIPYVPEIVSNLLNRSASTNIPKRDTYGDISVYYPRYWSLPRPETRPIVAYSFRRTLHNHRELFEPADLINAHVALPDGFGLISITRQLDIPLVTTVHGADIYKSAENIILRKQIKSVFNHSKETIINSDMLLSEARETFTNLNDAHVVYNGIPTDQIRDVGAEEVSDTFSEDRLVLVTVGTLIQRKGHKVVIDALKKLPKKSRPYYLVIGEGPLREKLESYVSAANLEDYVHFTGYVPDHEAVFAKLKAADIMAMPSSDEAFGIAYLEGMACGLPTIACEGEGPADFMTHRETGFLVPPYDSEAIAEIIQELHDNPDLRQHVADRGQRTALNAFSWERNAKSVEQIFGKAIEEYK